MAVLCRLSREGVPASEVRRLGPGLGRPLGVPALDPDAMPEGVVKPGRGLVSPPSPAGVISLGLFQSPGLDTEVEGTTRRGGLGELLRTRLAERYLSENASCSETDGG